MAATSTVFATASFLLAAAVLVGYVHRLGIAARDDRVRFLEAALESSPEPVAVVDRQGVILRFNLAAEQLFGASKKSMLGSKLSTLFHSESREAPQQILSMLFSVSPSRSMAWDDCLGIASGRDAFPMCVRARGISH